MRIPLTRDAVDETPIAWWEWLFSPIIFLLIPLAMVAVVPVGIGYSLRQHRKQRKLRSQLIAAGRFLSWPDLEWKLEAGEGTLIVDCPPKGPIWEWWTPDDVVTVAPVTLPTSPSSLPENRNELVSLGRYAHQCAARYVDIDAGAALLTKVRIWGRRPFARGLSDRYPRCKIVTLAFEQDGLLPFRSDVYAWSFSAASKPRLPSAGE